MSPPPASGGAKKSNMSVYRFSCTSIDGEPVPLEKFRGQVLLIVNTASKCGFTPQYRGLEMLYRDYKDRGFSVLAFPCDQFLKEEYEDNRDIQDFCIRNYQVTFPLFARIDVHGERQEPLFTYLKESAPGWLGLKSIKWNFTKFLVDRQGRCVRRFATATYPNHLRKHIEHQLD